MLIIGARIPLDASGFSVGEKRFGAPYLAASPLIPVLYGLYVAVMIQYHF